MQFALSTYSRSALKFREGSWRNAPRPRPTLTSRNCAATATSLSYSANSNEHRNQPGPRAKMETRPVRRRVPRCSWRLWAVGSERTFLKIGSDSRENLG